MPATHTKSTLPGFTTTKENLVTNVGKDGSPVIVNSNVDTTTDLTPIDFPFQSNSHDHLNLGATDVRRTAVLT